jgi:hypothetical protein
MKVIFDVQSLYYLPQYLPVYNELLKNGISSTFVFYESVHDHVVKKIAEDHGLSFSWVKNDEEAVEYYEKKKADWVFFGNTFSHLDRVHCFSKSAQLGHGIGPKASYYSKSNRTMSVRFVEGEYRRQRLANRYPDGVFVDVGFCKLDPIFNGEMSDVSLSRDYGLNNNLPTILYAPTFYPSSIERFPSKWPLEFKNFNIIIKPHYFSLTKKTYRKQRTLLNKWSKYDNVYLAKPEDYSLLPFFQVSDVLISDASSSLFEFALLNKPVVWCDFLKLRWNYRGIFSYKFKRRMDQDYGVYANVAIHAEKYKDLKSIVDSQLKNPKELEKIRLELAEKLAGKTDGLASKRIVDYLIKHA